MYMYIYIYVHVDICIYVYMYVSIWVCVCVCVARLIYELEEDLLAIHQELIGQIPQGLLQRGQRTSHFFKKIGDLKHISCVKPW